jgi:hypothetical protein
MLGVRQVKFSQQLCANGESARPPRRDDHILGAKADALSSSALAAR